MILFAKISGFSLWLPFETLIFMHNLVVFIKKYPREESLATNRAFEIFLIYFSHQLPHPAVQTI